jgi:hypothetical protein
MTTFTYNGSSDGCFTEEVPIPPRPSGAEIIKFYVSLACGCTHAVAKGQPLTLHRMGCRIQVPIGGHTFAFTGINEQNHVQGDGPYVAQALTVGGFGPGGAWDAPTATIRGDWAVGVGSSTAGQCKLAGAFAEVQIDLEWQL